MPEQIVVKIFNTRYEAEIARGLLESHGVTCFISGDDEGGMAPFPFSPTSKGILLFTNEKDLPKAKELLK